MSRQKILIVEDDPHIVELISINLKKEGYEIIAALNGEAALVKARTESPDCILLDLMLPGIDGMQICRTLKSDVTTRSIPIIMVTAKSEESDIVAGLEIGADDYLAKPFSPKVLIARVRAVVRRKSRDGHEDTLPLTLGEISIHPGRHEVLVNNVRIELTNLEFRVLYFLASRPGWVFTRYQIVEAVRGDNYPVTDRSVDVVIVGLRKKLGTAGDLIKTIRGVGYRFMDEQP